MRPKGSFIDTEWGLAHVPDIQVEEGTTQYRVGFMQYDDPPEDKPKPEPAPKRVPYWKRVAKKPAQRKGQKRGPGVRLR